jgi:enoyl-CoA hydratase
MPEELADAVERANAEPDVRVIVLSGAGRSFCAGYDLDAYAQTPGANPGIQEMPWDPLKDFSFMKRNTDQFMSLWRSPLPVIAKIQGHALAGGSDMALCADLLVIGEGAKLGYPPARVWGCPTTAMWVYRIGAERAKRLLLTGDTIDGRTAQSWGLGQCVPDSTLDDTIEDLAQRIATIPRNQLIMQKLMVNQTLENMGIASTQTLATLLDGIARHSPEGVNFKQRAETLGWKQAVRDRDEGTFDWTRNQPFKKEPGEDNS